MAVLSRAALTAPESYEAWLAVYVRLVDTLPEPRLPACSNCGRFELNYRFVADPKTRIGFCPLWCDACRHGATISRVRVPAGVDFIDIADADALAGEVPDFEAALPSTEPTRDTARPTREWLFARVDELRPLVAEYERLLATLDAHHERRDAVELARSELDILDALMAGWSREEVARRLGLSERVVDDRLTSARRKLGLAGRR